MDVVILYACVGVCLGALMAKLTGSEAAWLAAFFGFVALCAGIVVWVLV